MAEHARAETSIGPGFNPFLASCQTILGERPLAARLLQARPGVPTVWLMYQSTREFVFARRGHPSRGDAGRGLERIILEQGLDQPHGPAGP